MRPQAAQLFLIPLFAAYSAAAPRGSAPKELLHSYLQPGHAVAPHQEISETIGPEAVKITDILDPTIVLTPPSETENFGQSPTALTEAAVSTPDGNAGPQVLEKPSPKDMRAFARRLKESAAAGRDGANAPEKDAGLAVFDGAAGGKSDFFKPVAAGLSPRELANIPGFEHLNLVVSRRGLRSWKFSSARQAEVALTRELLRIVLKEDAFLRSLALEKEAPATIEAAPYGYYFVIKNHDGDKDETRGQDRALWLLKRLEQYRGISIPAPIQESLVRELTREYPLIARNYFDHPPAGRALVDLVINTARDQGRARYLLETKDRVSRLYKRFFPAFYREFPLIMSSHDNAYHRASSGYHIYERDSDFHKIGLVDHDATHANDHEPPLKSLFGETSRKIGMLLTSFHEYAHGIFDEFAGPYSGPPRGYQDPADRAYDAMTEGFAVMLELLNIDKMVAAKHELGLSDADATELLAWKRGRLSYLKKRKNHYTEGTFYFWHSLYKREGEAGMLRFLRSLNAGRLSAMSRGDPIYILTQGSPGLFKPFLTGKGAPNVMRDIELIRSHLQGAVLDDRGRASAGRFLSRAKLGSMIRFLGHHLAGMWPLDISSAFRLAELSRRVSGELRHYLLRAARNPMNLFHWLDDADYRTALLKGAESLPWTRGQKKTWADTLLKWVRSSKPSEDKQPSNEAWHDEETIIIRPELSERLSTSFKITDLYPSKEALKGVLDHVGKMMGIAPEEAAKRAGVEYPKAAAEVPPVKTGS